MIKQRRNIADYLNVGTDTEKYAFMGTGFTDLNESPSAQTSSKKYINSKSATKAINGYDWSAPFTTDQIRTEEAIEFICNIGEKELLGADAETEYVKVDLDKKVGASGTEYEARKRRVAIEVSEFSNNDGEMQASGNLLGISDWEFGKFDTTTKAFTAESSTPTE
jgi:hypothetical protein|uniref:Uncharacterized protein n=1 Tax=Siphoviridae sp. ctWDo30 TaxID=2826360 RepID=A0A8S5N4Z0_9CAUD|nr:MAG TPA: hypothetical protein [Siphoviridae sp. ctWDo30]